MIIGSPFRSNGMHAKNIGVMRSIPFLLALVPALAFAGDTRVVEATFTATLTDLPRQARELRVWIPIPASRGPQAISDLEIDSPYVWHRGVDREFGNHYIYTTIRRPRLSTLTVRIQFRARRSAQLLARGPVDEPSPRELQRNLRADRLVTLSPRIRRIADEVTAGRTTPLTQARAIYDYVLAEMVYDKTRPGWGKGDSERACDIKAGNCTDFHSLFISLARAKGIPARFLIGFSLPQKGSGSVSGYHCWAEFHVGGLGWIAVDPSEASKSSDPVLRNFLFGNLQADRIEFTAGRDLVLDPQTVEPVNYLIYPYAEADGRPAGVGAIALDYRDHPAAPMAEGVAGRPAGSH